MRFSAAQCGLAAAEETKLSRFLTALALAAVLPASASAQVFTTLTIFESSGTIGPPEATAYLGGVLYYDGYEATGLLYDNGMLYVA